MSVTIVETLWMYGLAAIVALLIAALIKVIVVLLGTLVRTPAADAAPRAATDSAPAVPDVAGDHIAAISAAVYAAIGAHRIVHIEDLGRSAGWVTEGRLAHHASHSVPTHAPKR